MKHTEEWKKQHSLIMKEKQKDPEYVAKMFDKIRSFKGRHHTEETKKILSIRSTGRKLTQEQRNKISVHHKGKKRLPSAVMATADFLRGLPKTEDHKRKISEANKGKTVSLEKRRQLSLANKGHKDSRETKEKKSKSSKQKWQNLEYKESQLFAIWQGTQISPNKPETFIMDLLDNLYPGEWKFTGDFSFMIGGKNPDFVNCNGQKKIIELFGDYWHKGENPQDRIDIFKPFGFETLIIWERELKDFKLLRRRIFNFAEKKEEVLNEV